MLTMVFRRLTTALIHQLRCTINGPFFYDMGSFPTNRFAGGGEAATASSKFLTTGCVGSRRSLAVGGSGCAFAAAPS